MSNNNTTLKPCPLCKSNNTKIMTFDRHGAYSEFWDGFGEYTTISCFCCGFETSIPNKEGTKETESTIISIWNTRISPAPPVPPAVGVEADGGAGSVEEMSEKQEKKIMEPIKIGKLIELADILTDEAFYHDCDGEDQIYEMAHELLTKLETYAKEQERDHEIY